jgi:DNA modification methylase
VDSPAPRLVVRRLPLDDLRPDPANPRTHDAENLAAIKGSLARFGQVEPLVVQRGTLRLIAGHGRLTAMRALGWRDAEIVELDVDDLQATALGIALNRAGELAGWDDAVLAKLLDELRTAGALDGVGFDGDDLDRLLTELEVGTHAADGTPPPPVMEDVVSRRGDLWLLGDHRLLCGDSAAPADVDRLVAGSPVHLLNTDPPYNVKVEPRSNNAIAAGLSSFAPSTHHQRFDAERNPGATKPTHAKLRAKDRPLINDFLPEAEFDRLLRAWFSNAARVLVPGGAVYIWGGYANLANYPPALRECGLYFSQGIVWVKEHPVLTRKDFMGNFELAFYGWKEGAGHRFFGPANVPDVWSVKKVSPQAMVHLTEKPVELAVRAIEYSSQRGERVLDLFGGSGSTLMACEATGRRGLLMEMDPAYADVIVRRYEAATQRTATLDGDGRSFAEVMTERSAS